MTAHRACVAALLIGLLGMSAYSHACSDRNLSAQNPQDAQAQYALAKAYEKDCDRTEAVKWYKLAAEQGHDGAQYEVGMAYIAAYRLPKEMMDEAEAIKWFLRSAGQGNVAAAMTLGSIYGNKADYAEALKWVKPLAEKGNVYAQAFLRDAIYRHDAATEQELEESRKWLRRAAEQGDIRSLLSLAEIYWLGEEVAADNKVESIRLFRLAAAQNIGYAQTWLGWAYLRGEGVAQNRETAREWLKLAFPKTKDEDLEPAMDALAEMDMAAPPSEVHAERLERLSRLQPALKVYR
ncbi:hypothetical protein AGMMS49545_22310 [Betaproteobacteria bacterium]|nr:hypothetical protein AGMMS49545_22310 [Betaproteobacteria bacterium]GHU39915.1 hypothetical protein AGMMS50289_00560 [Betaproteobacteria bacterium]